MKLKFQLPIYQLFQEEFKKKVHRKIVKEQEKKVQIKCGWYTEKQMKETLKMGKPGTYRFKARVRLWVRVI